MAVGAAIFFVAALFILLAIALFAGGTPASTEQSGEQLTFWPRSIADVAAGKALRPRASVKGYVTYKAVEADTDIHFRLCDSAKVTGMDTRHCIVCEIMTEIPVAAPRVGQQVTVDGIVRYDGEHKWWELHPVERVK